MGDPVRPWPVPTPRSEQRTGQVPTRSSYPGAATAQRRESSTKRGGREFPYTPSFMVVVQDVGRRLRPQVAARLGGMCWCRPPNPSKYWAWSFPPTLHDPAGQTTSAVPSTPAHPRVAARRPRLMHPGQTGHRARAFPPSPTERGAGTREISVARRVGCSSGLGRRNCTCGTPTPSPRRAPAAQRAARCNGRASPGWTSSPA